MRCLYQACPLPDPELVTAPGVSFPILNSNIWGSCLVKGESFIPLAQSRPQ